MFRIQRHERIAMPLRGRVRPSVLVLLSAAFACAPADPGAPLDSEPRFRLLSSSETGVAFANVLPENPVMNGFVYEYYYSGGGVAVGDLSGNGFPDLYDPELRRNRLYINQGTRDGAPSFSEEAAAYGLDDPGHSAQAAFFHIGDELYMYLVNHGVDPNRSVAEIREEWPEHALDRLYHKVGDRFVDVSSEAGLVGTSLGFGLGVSVGDVNGSGLPDIYVANDYFGRDYLYLARSGGRFEEALEEPMGHIPYASMGSDMADIDGDGRLDLFVAEMAMPTHYDRNISESGTEGERFLELVAEDEFYQYQANALQWNRGSRWDGVPVFSDVAQLAGVARTDWSWATLFADLDNSGRQDLFVTTGIASNFINVDINDERRRRAAQVIEAEGRITHGLILELLENQPRRNVPNYAFRNEGDLTLTDQTAAWGLDEPSYSHGAVYADLDRDGALDLVAGVVGGEVVHLRTAARPAAVTLRRDRRVVR